MITLKLARQLKDAGLAWKPEMFDLFGVPERGMDQRCFVISDMFANIESLFGRPVVAFQGASEWALDHLVTSEAVWLPSETQLRKLLDERLAGEDQPAVSLARTSEGWRCQLTHQGESLAFEDSDAVQAYGLALLHILQSTPQPERPQAGEGGGREDIWEQSLGDF